MAGKLRKDPKNDPKRKPISDRFKIFHRHFPKSFSPPKICKNTKIFSRTHPSHDVIFFGQILAKKTAEMISVHDVCEPGKQALLASRDVIPFESKSLPAVLLLLRLYFLKITVTVTVLKFG